MYGSIVWKFLLTAVIVAWAASNLVPVQDTPFPDYIRDYATAHQDEFSDLMDRAEQRAAEDVQMTEFMALREIANAEEIDLHRFFPRIRLEEGLRNIERRNNLVLNEILQQSQASLQLGLDLQGGVSFTLAFAEPDEIQVAGHERELMLEKAIEIIRTRADGLGVSEPIIRPVGDSRIEVQLPGVTTRDNPDITEELQRPALLEFRLVHRDRSLAFADDDDIPPGYERLYLERETGDGDIERDPHIVTRIPELGGDSISRARAVSDEYGRFKVLMDFTTEGGRRFAEITRQIERDNRPQQQDIGQLAIVLDGELYSAPSVRQAITGGSAEITGQFSQREAFELANVLNNPLDVPLEIVEMYEVGPSLAEDSIGAAQQAMVIGSVLVLIFMVSYYLFAGAVACVTLVVNVIVILGVLASIGATLTLPGIAGIILTIGMAVDANILIFERIREELRLGKSLKSSLTGGYEKALSTIVDANVTTLLTASILIYFGTGPVKGFGVTLAIGIFTSMFGALVISRFLLEFLINPGFIKKLPMFSILQDSNIDFLKWRKPAFITSWAIVAVGLIAIGVKGDRIYGIDFAGGDEINLSFEERLDTTEIERVALERELGEVIPVYRSPIGGTAEELRIQTEFDMGDAVFHALNEEFPNAGLQLQGENRIGPTVGAEIRRNAMLAIGAALVVILLYVALRFEMGYGIGAVIAVMHDLLMTIGIFILSGRQFTAPMVAGILMVVGYSINDTIVVFDRIREQLTLDPNSKLRDVVNKSINRILARSVLTSFTTLLATGSLYVFGGGVVNDFAFIFIIGIITGTFSSIFIASPIFFWWHKGDRRHVEERKDVLPNYEWVASSKASK